jgi:ADP-ribose pyrophosphatase
MAEMWKRIEPTIKHRIGYRHVVTKLFRQPNGNVYDFTTTSAEGARSIATVALTSDNQVIVARQYRPGPEKILDELPGGGAEPDEDLEEAARRELEEETGYTPGSMRYLGMLYRSAYSNSEAHYFLGTDCVPTHKGQELEETEHIDVVAISIAQLLENARTGKMSDVGGVLLAHDALQERMI